MGLAQDYQVALESFDDCLESYHFLLTHGTQTTFLKGQMPISQTRMAGW